MSTRSRGAPWFVEQPRELQRRMLQLLPKNAQYVEWRPQWSWDGITWFDQRGDVAHLGTTDEYFARMRKAQ